jgi:hypothetical protein
MGMALSSTDPRSLIPARGLDLREAFLLLWSVYLPDLLTQAHEVHPIAAARESDPAEADQLALDLAFAGAASSATPRHKIPDALARIYARARLDGTDDAMAFAEVQAQARRLEAMVCQVLIGIGDDVEARRLRLTGVHGGYRRSFEPDPAAIRRLSPAERLDSRATCDGALITHLRILPPGSETQRLPEELPGDPRQLTMTLSKPQPGPKPYIDPRVAFLMDLHAEKRRLRGPGKNLTWDELRNLALARLPAGTPKIDRQTLVNLASAHGLLGADLPPARRSSQHSSQ